MNIDSSAKIYRNVDIRYSNVGKMSIIGDSSILFKSDVKDHVAISRRNLIHNSTISEFTYTGMNAVIKHASIGRFNSISWNVSIGGKNHEMNNVTTHSRWWFNKLYSDTSIKATEYEESATCEIGSDVWIASNAIILRDVTVGNGAVIGAGALVNKDIEPYTVVAGVPAKPIRNRFDEKTIDTLMEVAWWDWPIEVIKNNLDLIYSTKVDDIVISKLLEIKKKL